MKRYSLMLSSCFAFVLVLFALGCKGLKGARPNVVWILLDAARAHNFSCYGYERETSPRLDELAKQGVLFEQHFTQAMWTGISVPSYMSGRYFPVLCHEPEQPSELPRQPDGGEKLLPEILAENGYETVTFSAHGLFGPTSRLAKSFERFVIISPADKGRHVYAPFAEVNSHVFSWLREPKDRPFFLYMHMMDTHFPHRLDAPFDRWTIPGYTSDQIAPTGRPAKKHGSNFSETDREQLRGMYDGGILYADYHVGALVNMLRALNLFENTILIITADHGELLGEDSSSWEHILVADRGDSGEEQGTAWEYMAQSHDWLMHIPLIMVGPGLPRGKRVSQITENADIVPSLIDLLQIETAARTDGQSFVPLLYQQTAKPIHRYAFAKWVGRNYEGPVNFIIRDFHYKYQYYEKDGAEYLWRVPEVTLPCEDLIEAEPEVRAKMREYVFEHLVPLRNRYLDLPVVALHFPVLSCLPDKAEPREAFVVQRGSVTTANRTDNKWAFLENDKYLFAAPWQEEVGPITMSFGIPNGRYFAQVQVMSSDNFWGARPATSLRVKAEDDSDFKVITEASRVETEPLWVYVDIGGYDVSDGRFDVTLAPGEKDHWVIVRRFRLIPQGPAVSTLSPEQRREREERIRLLRGLGYLK